MLAGLAAGALAPARDALGQSRGRGIGLLALIPFPPLIDPFLAALRERGWTPGQNLGVALGVRGASFVDRIFPGARPGELPIEHPSRFHLHVSAKRAKLIGLTLPRSILVRADRIIE